jgi:predicted metalloprotease
MRYDESDEVSKNIEDRRGQSSGGRFGFPGFPRGGGRRVRIPFPMGGGRARGGGISLIGLLIIGGIMLLLGINPLKLLMGGGGGLPDLSNVPQLPQFDRSERSGGSPFDRSGGTNTAASDQAKLFVGRVLRDTEVVWTTQFRKFGRTYKPPTLVLYSGFTRTGCGQGQAAMGPFYCPLDQKVYLDTSFFEELRRKFRAPGDFAQAYVIAHEVGHHVQNLIGIARKVQEIKQTASREGANRIQVRMELQADCLSGVWAYNLKSKRLEPGDIREGLNAASAIGDDMIQRRTTGRVVPDAFTHGTSEQRARWFRRGYESGEMRACDTFRARDL